ncbi:unnamed protein product, partial [Ceratitis capitata]
LLSPILLQHFVSPHFATPSPSHCYLRTFIVIVIVIAKAGAVAAAAAVVSGVSAFPLPSLF